MNREVEKARGTQSNSAITEVKIVPTINDKAPYFSLPSEGFHAEEVIKPKPYSLKTGKAPLIRDRTIPELTSTTISDASKRIVLVIFSLFSIWFCQFIYL